MSNNNNCPKCNEEILSEFSNHVDGIRITTEIWYCKKCLFKFDSYVSLEKPPIMN